MSKMNPLGYISNHFQDSIILVSPKIYLCSRKIKAQKIIIIKELIQSKDKYFQVLSRKRQKIPVSHQTITA